MLVLNLGVWVAKEGRNKRDIWIVDETKRLQELDQFLHT